MKKLGKMAKWAIGKIAKFEFGQLVPTWSLESGLSPVVEPMKGPKHRI